MVFGLSGSKSKTVSNSQSQSSSFGYGYSGSRSEELSRALSGSTSESGSEGSSFSTQRLAYQPIFEALFANASGATAQAASNVPAIISASNRLFSGGTSFLDELATGGPGAAYLEDRVTGADGIADSQIEQLGADIGRFLETEVNPAITQRGIEAGQLGGSRGEVALGEAGRAALEEFSRGSTSIRAGDQASRDAAASTLLSSLTARAGTGLAGIGGVQDVLRIGAGASLDPYAALAGILGPQTVLTEAGSEQASFGQSESFSEALATALATAFGEDFSASQSSSSSSSVGKSKSFGLSFGA